MKTQKTGLVQIRQRWRVNKWIGRSLKSGKNKENTKERLRDMENRMRKTEMHNIEF